MGTSKSRIAKLMLGALLITGLASAGLVGDGDGESIVMTPAPCMSELYKAKGGSGGLGCTSNDIRVAGVATKTDPQSNQQVPDITFLDVTTPGESAPHQGCRFPGDTVRFTAKFNVLLSATARHDIGIYFSVDADDNNDGALTSDTDVKPSFNAQKQYVSGGGCVAATPQYKPSPFFDLDGKTDPFPGTNVISNTQDRCGDIAGNDALKPEIEVTTICDDPDGDSRLNLPVCVSWRQPGANALCLSPEDAYPGAPSKCNCDAGFEVPIIIPPGSITVTKTPGVTSVMEPGGLVTFTVTVKNEAPFKSGTTALHLRVTDIVDSDFGVIFDAVGSADTTNNLISNNTCLTADKVLSGQEILTCTFTAMVSGNGDDVHNNLITATAVNSANSPVPPASDDATVNIVDVLPTITVDKTANPTSVQEPGGNVTYTVKVTNTSPVEALTLTSLVDDKFGNLNGKGTCVTGGSIPSTNPDSFYQCTFTGNVSGAPGTSHVNTVTGTARDNDLNAQGQPNEVSDSDTASVDILNTESDFSVTKTASTQTVNEPGGTVTFTVRITNTSAVDAVQINTITDSIYGNLVGRAGSTCSVPQTLPATNPDSSYQCTFTASITGNAGTVHTNVVTACGVDDDGNPLCRNGTETVTIVNVAPAASLTKTVESAKVTFKVVIRNDSNAADPITLNSLMDVVNGGQPKDLTIEAGAILDTTCAIGGVIQPGATYECTFEALVTESQTDTVTGKLKDNDNTDVSPNPSDSATVNLVD